jgi:hypothetical protein
LLILSLITGSIWFETISTECNQSVKHIWSTLLHNRWNVFVGAEDHVTWEVSTKQSGRALGFRFLISYSSLDCSWSPC